MFRIPNNIDPPPFSSGHSSHKGTNGGNGGVKNKMLNNSSILMGEKKYVEQIYKKKLNTKNPIDWIKIK